MEGMMSRIGIVILTGILLTGCQNSLPAQEMTVGATIPVVDPYSFNFGTISNREPVSHEFDFVNNGARELHITGKTSSCGCTVSEISKETLLPGDRAILKVTFNPKGYAGVIHQFVYLNTDDPDKPVYKFTILADVR
jgi:hypothetical protein